MTIPVACVIGWPVAHSRSPIIHRFWLQELGLSGDYVRQPVAPEEIQAFLKNLAERGYVGGNVTVPHKEAAFAAATEVDAAGQAVGAVNTLWIDGGQLIASNTDSLGFLANLDEKIGPVDGSGRPASVLGAGGAARATVWALLSRGFEPIHVVNRTIDRAEVLATRFGKSVRPASWSDLPRLLRETKLLVNTTSLGMVGQPELVVDLAPLPEDAIVTDLVYVPIETGLLRAARARRLVAVDGLGMLLHQAAPGFERWFGKRPTVTPELRAAVLATIEAQ
ncbi:MAG: shikimate dehydrogenase [Bauldia sp.]